VKRSSTWFAAVLLAAPGAASAQRAAENAVTQADDAFGQIVGNERTGLYSDGEVRGFSPVAAGNVRLDGLYFNQTSRLSARLIRGSTIRVGLTAQNYPFSAPTGVQDYALRTPGEAAVLSLSMGRGPFEGGYLEVDGQSPVIDGRLHVGGGVAFRREANAPGDTGDYLSAAAIGRWRSTRAEVKVFWSGVRWNDDYAAPFVYPAEPVLPQAFERRFYGQPWAQTKGFARNYGLIADVRPWRDGLVRLGLFRSHTVEEGDYADLFMAARADGSAQRVMVTEPPQRFASTSGELRLTQIWRADDTRHVVHAAVRARFADSDYGGAAIAGLGPARVGVRQDLPRPAAAFSRLSRQDLRQVTFGLGYEIYLHEVGQAALGVQQTRYEKEVRFPDEAINRSEDSPTLVNVTAAWKARSDLVLFGSYVTGLEESGTAPENAANYPDVLPALRTWQRDLGARWSPSPRIRLIVGTFEIQKPYFSFDAERRFVHLGQVRNRGTELSLTAEPAPGLAVLVGAAVFRPVIDVKDGPAAGARPPGLPANPLRASLDYRPPGSPYSVDVTLSYSGRRAVDPANLIQVPPTTVIDLGARRRLRLAGADVTLRAVLLNVTDAFGWRAYSSGAIQPIEPRRLLISLTADF